MSEEHNGEWSTRPVSSLRSHFENMLSVHPTSNASPRPPSRQASPQRSGRDHNVEAWTESRISLDAPPPAKTSELSVQGVHEAGLHQSLPYNAARRPPIPSASKPRPISMRQPSPASLSTPTVTVETAQSPLGKSDLQMAVPSSKPSIQRPFTPQELSSALSHSHPVSHVRVPSRPVTPAIEAKQAFLLSGASPSTSRGTSPGRLLGTPDADESKSISGESLHNAKPAPAPPLVNRAAKPKVPRKPSGAEPGTSSLAPEAGHGSHDERVSSFSTPPGSSDSSVDAATATSHLSTPSTTFSATDRDSYVNRPPVPHMVARKHQVSVEGVTHRQSTHMQREPLAPNKPNNIDQVYPQSSENRPGLPPRRDMTESQTQHAPSRPHELPGQRSVDLPSRSASTTLSTNFHPPPKRNQTVPSRSGVPAAHVQVHHSGVTRGLTESQRPLASHVGLPAKAEQSMDVSSRNSVHRSSASEYPDSAHANRRPPFFAHDVDQIATKYDTKLFDVCGEYVCTTGYLTRACNVITGEVIMDLAHAETTKMTSIAFKPARKIEEEGQRIWVGNNLGELYEIDISVQTTVNKNTVAHARREITRIFRHKAEMWTIDDEGKVFVWPSDTASSPNMSNEPHAFRVPRGHSFSLVSGDFLWIANGKDIRLFQPSTRSSTQFQVLERPLCQPSAGDVTSGATMNGQHARVYFGHADGKITAYSGIDFSCVGIYSVGVYKINCLAAIGGDLWAGYNTGMIYVYDTSTTPWNVKKNWLAHDHPVAKVIVDRSSIWKLDRLQVVSLGLDNTIKIWDGMLKDDWLESQMQRREASHCDYREVTSLVISWNAGATRPGALRHDEQDANFFRELFPRDKDLPDIVVFGLQELVDLEDKRVMAKAFFKSKKKEAPEQDHMSSQYREWRDHLMFCLDRYSPASQEYSMLHSASLVGLFTCVFVRTVEKMNVRDVQAAEVKTGMGGQHGNKGALVVRFLLDDTSLCFVNCHLAAGQTSTVQRNNDLVTILETSALPGARDPATRSDFYTNGGDGCMILDHEVCILNGDLNYRIDTMTRDNIVAAIKKGDLSKLLERDQLLLSRKRNPGFRLRAFEEAKIEFAPTYKYDIGTDNYDSSEKKRAPAWCDRLLYRGVGRVEQLDYRRHDTVKASDHRPVSGKFRIKVKTVDRKARRQAWEECERAFEEVKKKVADEARLDYLVNVFGVAENEARRLLA